LRYFYLTLSRYLARIYSCYKRVQWCRAKANYAAYLFFL